MYKGLYNDMKKKNNFKIYRQFLIFKNFLLSCAPNVFKYPSDSSERDLNSGKLF